MKWVPSKFGAEPKKLAIVVGLLVVAGYFYFSNRESGGTVSATPGTTNPSSGSPVRRTAARTVARARRLDGLPNSTPGDFRPSMPKSVDPSGVDPTLRLEELSALRRVEIEGSTRSLFELSSPPAAVVALKDPAPIQPKPLMVGPVAPPPPPPPPPDPKAPPIPLKFYGFVNQSKGGDKRAFFLDGEDIVIANEGDMIKKRYKIIRIGVNSATVEDTQFKSNNQQTLPLEAEMNG
jgi:hypothetical protein